MKQWIGAIETGGTKSLAALADRRGEVMFLPPEAGCNPQDGPEWEGRLRALMAAMARHGALEQVVIGIAGFAEVPTLDTAVLAVVAEGLGPQASVMNDVALSFHAAFGHGPGVLVLAGTGSMAMARGDGDIARTGGWGDLVGDEGSAFWIGQRALKLAARALDGQGGDADFARALMARLGEGDDPGAPLRWVMAARERSAIAGVARHVDALAETGQATAVAILQRGAGHLARQARGAARLAGLGAPLPWSAAGSVVMRCRTLAAALAEELGAPPVPARFNGLGGGLWLAAERAGWATGGAWSTRIGAATRAWGAL